VQNPTSRCVAKRRYATLLSAGSWLILTSLPTAPLRAESPTEIKPPIQSTIHSLVGSASCAASNCHGGTSAPGSGPLYAAHRIWLTQDQHANAYNVLYDSRSTRMIQQLGAGWSAAHKEQRCLACHAHAESHTEKHAPTFQVADGVSCEACHGPAQDWIRDHSRRDVWNSLTIQEKADRGFRDLGNFAARAEHCVKCHVGAADREVNHDMIAAGHPRLAFELAGYSAIYRKHWRIEKDQARAAATNANATVDAQLWSNGQWALAKATLELTKHRAQDPAKPWPEFTEYGCFACHHDLRADSWRQFGAGHRGQAADGERVGLLVWQPWNLALVQEVAADPLSLQPTMKQLRLEMGRGGFDRDQVQQLTDQALTQLGSNFQPQYAADGWSQTLQAVTASNAVERDWERAVQSYLATVALTSGTSDAAKSSARVALQESAGKTLRFAPGVDSPHDSATESIAQLRTQFQRLHELYGQP